MKKTRTLLLVICLLAVAVIGGTLAYFTDTDDAKNVMTVGSVDIEQHEQERGEDGTLQAFTQNKPVVPGVGAPKWGETIEVGDGKQKVMDVENVIDKFDFVENTGKSNAYVRTIIVLEAPGYDSEDLIHVNFNDSVGVTATAWTPVDIEGVQYVYAVFTYTDALAPAAKTNVSLAQVYLDPKTTNEDVEAYGETWEILCLSQAAQEAGFDTAAEALDTAFGEATAANVADWFTAG